MNLAGKLPYLRILCNYSDDCNFHCRWCHHEGVYTRPKRDLLTPEQISFVAELFYELGVRKFKILGGEPTLRDDLGEIIHCLRGFSSEIDISIVTNGSRLNEKIEEYREAGLSRVNVSLFTLDEEYFADHIGNPELLHVVLDGIDKTSDLGMISKINHIFHSEKDLESIIEFARKKNVRINLLNEIPTSKGGRYTDIAEILNVLKKFGIQTETVEDDPFSLPVKLFKLENGVNIEVKHMIISDQQLFDSCRNCGYRSKCKEGIYALRLTPEGMICPCLVRTDNQFDIIRGNHDEFINYLLNL